MRPVRPRRRAGAEAVRDDSADAGGDMRRPAPAAMPAGLLLTLNAGSATLKFAAFATPGLQLRARGLCELREGALQLTLRDGAGQVLQQGARALSAPPGSSDARGEGFHAAAAAEVIACLRAQCGGDAVIACGHRIVHGGPDHAGPALADAALIAELTALSDLAPLHQPHNLAALAAAGAAWPRAVQIACFDTAFHRAVPRLNQVFALPRAFFDQGVRRYGFHGLSYAYLSTRLRACAPGIAAGRVVFAHLGSGASLCAVQDGAPVASTMGFSALDGLCMGTRCGQIDPGVLLYLLGRGMDHAALTQLLYQQSGLLGLSGVSADMRTLQASPDPAAAEAIGYFTSRICRETAALAAAMGGIDALVFAGGIGEHAPAIRAAVLRGLAFLGFGVDGARNEAGEFRISPDAAKPALVMSTDEEAMIARESWDLVQRLAPCGKGQAGFAASF